MSSSIREKNFISLVAYLHNAETQVIPFIKFVTEVMEQNFDKCEIIFVNDASEDGSVERIKTYVEEKKENPVTSIVNMSHYHGLEASMNAGRDLAIGDFVFEFDTLAINYKEELIMEVYKESLLGSDIVAAAPKGKTEFLPGLFYFIYNRFRNAISDQKLCRETFRIISRRAINRIQSMSRTIPYRKEMYQNCGLRYQVIHYEKILKEKKTRRKKENSNRIDLAFDSLLIFTDVVQKIALILSVLFLLFTFGVGIYTIVIYFSANKPVEGWAPIMGFLTAGFSGIFILLTVILKYMSVMLNMIFSKKKYLISSIEKINV